MTNFFDRLLFIRRLIVAWVTLILLSVTFPALALHLDQIDVSQLENQSLSLHDRLHFQLSPIDIPLKTVLSSPDWHHATESLANSRTTFRLNDQALWLMGTFKNGSEERWQGVVNYQYKQTRSLEFFLVDQRTGRILKQLTTGTGLRFSQRELPIRTFSFSMMLEPEQEADLYIKAIDDGLVVVDLALWQKDSFERHISQQNLTTGAVIGILIILSCFCMIMHIMVKEPSTLYLSGFLSAWAMLFATQHGIAFEFIWPDTPEVNKTATSVVAGISLLFLSLFAQKSLQNQKHSLIERLHLSNILLSVAVIFLPLYTPASLHLALLAIASLIIVTSCMLLAFMLLLDDQPYSRAQAFIWTAFTLGISLVMLSQYGVIAESWLTEYIVLVISIITTFITASKVGSQYNLKGEKKKSWTSQASTVLQQYYDIYQNAVEGIFTCNLDGQLISANPTMVHTMGFKNFSEMKSSCLKSGILQIFASTDQGEKLFEEVITNGFVSNREIKFTRPDNRHIWLLVSMRISPTADNKQIYVHGAAVDITEKHQANQHQTYISSYDSVSGALNRQQFEKTIQRALINWEKDNNEAVVLYIDVNNFELIRESCGTTAGDSLVRQISEQLKATLKDTGELARIDLDTFAVCLVNRTSNEGFAIAYRLVESIKEFRFVWENNIFNVGLSIGMTTVYPQDKSASQLISRADAACQIARSKGTNRIHIFAEDDNAVDYKKSDVEWISIINQAIENNRFILFFQKITALNTEQHKMSYELLLKIKSEDDSLMSPNTFIPAAERYELMPAIDRWVISTWFRWVSQHPLHLDDFELCCINISGSSAADLEFREFLHQQFRQYDIPHNKICFELTEKSTIVNLATTLEFISAFKELGCKFSLDDFGSGFSSYGYLKNLPVDFIKIDGDFVKDLVIDPIDKAMVNSINGVAQAIGKKTIAESVESEEILNELKEIGVDYVQGRHIHPPAPLSKIIIS